MRLVEFTTCTSAPLTIFVKHQCHRGDLHMNSDVCIELNSAPAQLVGCIELNEVMLRAKCFDIFFPSLILIKCIQFYDARRYLLRSKINVSQITWIPPASPQPEL